MITPIQELAITNSSISSNVWETIKIEAIPMNTLYFQYLAIFQLIMKANAIINAAIRKGYMPISSIGENLECILINSSFCATSSTAFATVPDNIKCKTSVPVCIFLFSKCLVVLPRKKITGVNSRV